MSAFKDFFSGHSREYSTFRPGYPDQLFSQLASLCSQRSLAWDCATGSGQAAVNLASYFKEVIATDASASQISNATNADGVNYSVAAAENSGLEPQSVDLITVAQAMHWFNLGEFTQEVNRVLKPNGILAVWTYGLFSITPALDTLIEKLYGDIVGSYWSFERKMVEGGYADVEMPFEPVAFDAMEMNQRWRFADVIGYLNTWSAVRAYENAQKQNPLELIYNDMLQAWGDDQEIKTVTWPLLSRVWCKTN